MDNLFLILFLISGLGLIVGLIRPSILKFQSRKNVGLVTGGAMIASFILFGINTPTTPKEQVSDVVKVTPTTQPATTESTIVTGQAKSDTVAKNTGTPNPTTKTESQKTIVPAEYKSALNTAGLYASKMHMSKRKLYDQLTSSYGEKFTAEAAQYAIDNVKADWNTNALVTAKNYQNTMSMSPAKIHDQLASEYGEKFTQSEADYAIQHLND